MGKHQGSGQTFQLRTCDLQTDEYVVETVKVPHAHHWQHFQRARVSDCTCTSRRQPFWSLRSCRWDSDWAYFYVCLSLEYEIKGTKNQDFSCSFSDSLLNTAPRPFLFTHSHSLSHYTHSLIGTLHYTCCHDEIKGNQDLKICSHADSLILSLLVWVSILLSICLPIICVCQEMSGSIHLNSRTRTLELL